MNEHCGVSRLGQGCIDDHRCSGQTGGAIPEGDGEVEKVPTRMNAKAIPQSTQIARSLRRAGPRAC